MPLDVTAPHKNKLSYAFLCILVISSLLLASMSGGIHFDLLPLVYAQPTASAVISPSTFWGVFSGTTGDVQIGIDKKDGIAVRIEIPREFLDGVITSENDTHFIQSDIRNDYYYYSVVDEARHWSHDNRTSGDPPCYKRNFSIYDPNAPWCVEIWNYLNYPPFANRSLFWPFMAFNNSKFVRFIGLNSPAVGGIYNFTLFVANHTNGFGYPDFINAWNTTLRIPVSLSDNPGSIAGTICDGDDPSNTCPPIFAKGIVYARNLNTGQISRSYVNETTATFNITGLAPGSYVVNGSAGVFKGIAYTLTAYSNIPFSVGKGSRAAIVLQLRRAPQVCGTIQYRDSLIPSGLLAHSLSDHPYLPKLGFVNLTINAEATDPLGHIYRNMSWIVAGDPLTDTSSDSFRIVTGSNITYVGLDPYGTEFAGLADPRQVTNPSSSSYTLLVKIWITGYLQPTTETVTVSMPGNAAAFPCNQVAPNPIVMWTGAIISGTIQFSASSTFIVPESPNQAPINLGLSDVLFGGNVLVQAYDHSGVLRSVWTMLGTLPDGKASYGASTSIRFYVLGFSETHDRAWSGTWDEKDYGLPPDSAYTLNVFIRGYHQAATSPVVLQGGANATVVVNMYRGGAIVVAAASYDNKFHSRAIQSNLPWRFLNLTIPVPARIYFYSSSGITLGYVERLMVTGSPNGVGPTSFFVDFTGQNWNMRELWFYGFVPTHLANDTISIKGFTLGLVQQAPVQTFVDLGGIGRAFVTLLYANEIGLTVPIFFEPNLFGQLPESDFSRGESFSPNLSGAINDNPIATTKTLLLPIFGFGAQMLNGTLTGQGHFFYVPWEGSGCSNFGFFTDANHCFDYGLDVGGYTAKVPEFGFNKHFMQLIAPAHTFSDLFLEADAFVNVYEMGQVCASPTGTSCGFNAQVLGWVDAPPPDQVALSWVKVEASNGTASRSVPTLDGYYGGTGALNLPPGVYNITYSTAFYKSQIFNNVPVAWHSVTPLATVLCPLTGGPPQCSSFQIAPSFSPGAVSEIGQTPGIIAQDSLMVSKFMVAFE